MWEHHILAPGAGTIWTTIDSLNRERLLLWQIHLLGIEALQVGHIATQLGELYQCINLIGKQDGLLLINTLFVGAYLDKQVAARDTTTGIAHLSTIVAILARIRA